MTFDAPGFLQRLCSRSSIFPFSHYVERKSWKLHADIVRETFLNKAGLYCFWWTGPRHILLDRLNNYEYAGEKYLWNTGIEFGHDLIPAYVGMTSVAAKQNRRVLKGRMIDRLVRFPTGMRRWLSSCEEAGLVKRRTAVSDNFSLFGYPERIRLRLSLLAGNPDITLAEAQQFLDTHQPLCQELITEFDDDYRTLMYDNYSISFVPFIDEAELFYSEALAIGLLRPFFNHS